MARFVTGSHIKHHPNATDAQADENLVCLLYISICVSVRINFLELVVNVISFGMFKN